MAYVLGLLYADGAVEDVRKSSRTCYIHLSSKDYELLHAVREVMGSNHKIQRRNSDFCNIRGKQYTCSPCYYLRIGSKLMYKDLIGLGLSPRKSLKMRFPKVSSSVLSFFIRGYFDGDGCVNVWQREGYASQLKVIFTSGSEQYLAKLRLRLSDYLSIKGGSFARGERAFRLRYGKRDGLKILAYMYQDLKAAPYLKRKYQIYLGYLASQKLA